MSDLRGRIEQVLREHLLENARCITCGERATYQSVHQADVLLAVLRPDIDTTAALDELRAINQWIDKQRAAVDSWIGQP